MRYCHFWIRWRYPIFSQLFLSRFRHPIGCPGWRQYCLDDNFFDSRFHQCHSNIHGNHVHGRTSCISRRNGTVGFNVIVICKLHFYCADDPKIQYRQDGHFRVVNRRKRLPNFVLLLLQVLVYVICTQ